MSSRDAVGAVGGGLRTVNPAGGGIAAGEAEVDVATVGHHEAYVRHDEAKEPLGMKGVEPALEERSWYYVPTCEWRVNGGRTRRGVRARRRRGRWQ